MNICGDSIEYCFYKRGARPEFDLDKVLKEDPFQAIGQDPDFQHFLQMMR